MNPFTTFSFKNIPLFYTGIQCPTCDYKGMILTITDRSAKLDCGNKNCRFTKFYRVVELP